MVIVCPKNVNLIQINLLYFKAAVVLLGQN